MLFSHFILNILVFVTELKSSIIEIKTAEKNSFILYYGFFKYEHIYATV